MFKVAHKAALPSFYLILSFALVLTVLYDKSICFSSLSAVLRHAVFDFLLFLLPSAVQRKNIIFFYNANKDLLLVPLLA